MFAFRSQHPESSASPLGSAGELRFNRRCTGEHLLDRVKCSFGVWSSPTSVRWEMKTSRRIFALTYSLISLAVAYRGSFRGLAHLNAGGHTVWRSIAYHSIADRATIYQHENKSFTRQRMRIFCKTYVILRSIGQVSGRRAGDRRGCHSRP